MVTMERLSSFVGRGSGGTVPRSRVSARVEGTLLGVLSVAAFSLTLPLTRLGLPVFGVLAITAGRAAIAGLVALVLLGASRAPVPARAEWRDLVLFALGTIVGFPLFASLSMGRVDASHGAVVVAIVPLLTAIVGSRIGGERLPLRFWCASACGSAIVALFALRGVHEGLAVGDALLLAAGTCAAIGYAHGGKLARHLGGVRVVCWALVFCLPLSLPLAAIGFEHLAGPPSLSSIAALLYLGLVSQLGAYFSWNRALAVGGIARVSQTQLVQPFLTIVAAWLLLGEPLRADLVAFACLVVLSVAASNARARVPSVVPVESSKELSS